MNLHEELAAKDTLITAQAARITELEQQLKKQRGVNLVLCENMAAIGHALGTDEDDGGPSPILEAIARLKAAAPSADVMMATAQRLIAEVNAGDGDEDEKNLTVRGIGWMHSELLKGMADAAPSAPAVEQQPVAQMICPTCGKDRFKEPCPNMADECPMIADAHLLATPQAAEADKVREAILKLNPHEKTVLGHAHGAGAYCEGFDHGIAAAAELVASMAAQAPVREVPEVNDAKYSEAEKAIGKIIFQRYPRIKGVHCASITIGILEYMGLRHSALNYDQQERVDE